jgi:hypothetical protein
LEHIKQEELRKKNEAEEAARIEKNRREHEEMLRKKGIGDMALGTSRDLNVEEKKRRQYVRQRIAISQRSETTVEIHQMERKLQCMLADPSANVYDMVSKQRKSFARQKRKSSMVSKSSLVKRGKSEESAVSHDEYSNVGRVGNEDSLREGRNNSQDFDDEYDEGEEGLSMDDDDQNSQSSLADLAAMDWCEYRRHDYLDALDHAKDILINEMDEMQLQLSRSRQNAHAIHTRAKLMRYLGVKQKSKKKMRKQSNDIATSHASKVEEGDNVNNTTTTTVAQVEEEDEEEEEDIDLRIVKKYADYWSETESSESDSSGSEAEGTTPPIAASPPLPTKDSKPQRSTFYSRNQERLAAAALVAAEEKKKAKEARRSERRRQNDIKKTVVMRSEITSIYPDIEVMFEAQGKIVKSNEQGLEVIPDSDKFMTARRASQLALAHEATLTTHENIRPSSFVLPRQYLKDL